MKQEKEHEDLGSSGSPKSPAVRHGGVKRLSSSCKRLKADAQRYYDALKRITKYQLPERLLATAEKQYGLSGEEALSMAYDNIQAEAWYATKGKRRPK